jgi:hypothetical protein
MTFAAFRQWLTNVWCNALTVFAPPGGPLVSGAETLSTNPGFSIQ